jgi:integrase
MAETSRLSQRIIEALPAPEKGNKVFFFKGAKLQGLVAPSGFGCRVTANGARSYILNYRHKGVERRYTIGSCGDRSAIEAVKEARLLRQRIDRGEDPLADRKITKNAEVLTVGAVLDQFVAGHVRPRLRRPEVVEAALNNHVRPHVGKIAIHDLRRSHVAKMLDAIEKSAGPVAADRARSYLRTALAWWEARDEDFSLSRAIIRTPARSAGVARSRVLSGDEIRQLWPVLGDHGTFGALVKVLLLTGQRRCEIAGMTRSEIDADGVLTIPVERSKTKEALFVPLSKMALEVIEAQPAKPGSDFVFPCSTGTAFVGFSAAKRILDKALPLAPWTIHDLRRTARTLMARAGVRPDISERVLGHVIAAVAGVYDRHSYEAEKRGALEKLAGMIERIVNPPPANVLPLRRASE